MRGYDPSQGTNVRGRMKRVGGHVAHRGVARPEGKGDASEGSMLGIPSLRDQPHNSIVSTE